MRPDILTEISTAHASFREDPMPQPRSRSQGGIWWQVLLHSASDTAAAVPDWVIGPALFRVVVGACSFHEPSQCCLLGHSHSTGTSLKPSVPSLLLPLE